MARCPGSIMPSCILLPQSPKPNVGDAEPLNETTSEFFRRLSSVVSPDEAKWYQNVLDPGVQAQLRIAKPTYYSMLRTSVVPTMLNAGIKENVIPPTAEATLDVRALPDEDLDKFRAFADSGHQ